MEKTSNIIVVSGLPRSGTSLMMQMLELGGVEVVTDHERAADPDNPRGYFEYEPVKNLDDDATWLPQARGKCVKLISMLLYQLPPSEKYRILFMERDLDEVLLSQETMLKRRNQKAVPRAEMREAYVLHLEHLANWLAQRPDMAVLRVGYRNLVEHSIDEAKRICEFLGGTMDFNAMAKAVDPELYRNRNQTSQ